MARSFRKEYAYFVVIRFSYICDSGRRVGPRERPAVRRASIVRIESVSPPALPSAITWNQPAVVVGLF